MSVWLKHGEAIEGQVRASRKERAAPSAIGSRASGAGKHAVEWLTKVVAIAPGASNTRIITWRPKTVETELLTKIKRGRLDRVEDIMGPVSFPASGAVAIRGAALLVGGGWTAE
ncbi:hypothetical protein [Devosia riboflavina]